MAIMGIASAFILYSLGNAVFTTDFRDAEHLVSTDLSTLAVERMKRAAGRGSREMFFSSGGGYFQPSAGEIVSLKTLEFARSTNRLQHDIFQARTFSSSETICGEYSEAARRNGSVSEMDDSFAGLYSGWRVAGGAVLVPRLGFQLDFSYASPAIPAFPDGEIAARNFWREHSLSLTGEGSPITFEELIKKQ